MAKTETKVAVLKGQDAEDKVLEYLKRMNRPFGAVDVSANLKGAVSKAATQKILVALTEKGELVQKTYGKTTFFVANQANLDSVPSEIISDLEAELKSVNEENKLLTAETKSISAELSRLKAAPTDAELGQKISDTEATLAQTFALLEPLRSDEPVISAEDRSQVDAEWTKWRAEWIKRRKVFITFWELATDALTPQQANDLKEDLGIESDTPEHNALESGPLCRLKNLKRKRT